MCTMFALSRTAVSNSIAENRNPPSPEMDSTLSAGRTMEAAIVAVADDKWGEVPKAYVGLKEGCHARADELIEFCRARLAHFKCPKYVEFGPLPRTATGKIRKNELRARTKLAANER